MITIATIYKGKPIKLNFIRQNGDITIRAFHVRSEDGEFQFSIRHDANLFFSEMEKTIELIKNQLI